MGMTFYGLTQEELCDLMCGIPQEDGDKHCETSIKIKSHLTDKVTPEDVKSYEEFYTEKGD